MVDVKYLKLYVVMFIRRLAYMDVTDLLPHSVTLTPSIMERLAISAISPLLLDRFGRSRFGRFCHLEFDEEATYDELRSEKAELLWSC